jgi:hypothetical protein
MDSRMAYRMFGSLSSVFAGCQTERFMSPRRREPIDRRAATAEEVARRHQGVHDRIGQIGWIGQTGQAQQSNLSNESRPFSPAISYPELATDRKSASPCEVPCEVRALRSACEVRACEVLRVIPCEVLRVIPSAGCARNPIVGLTRSDFVARCEDFRR